MELTDIWPERSPPFAAQKKRGDSTFAHRSEEDHTPTLLCLSQHQLFCSHSTEIRSQLTVRAAHTVAERKVKGHFTCFT